MLGLTLTGLRRLQSLVGERSRNAFEVGERLVQVHGRPPAVGVMDGSRASPEGPADELGVPAAVAGGLSHNRARLAETSVPASCKLPGTEAREASS